MKNCPYCGTPLHDDATFCSMCGHQLPIGNQYQQQQQQQQQQQYQQQQYQQQQYQDPYQQQYQDPYQQQYQESAGEKSFLYDTAEPVTKMFDNGSFFRKPFVWLYYILAVLSTLFPLYVLYKLIEEHTMNHYPGSSLMVVIVLLAGGVGGSLYWTNRAKRIGTITKEGDDYVAIPAVAALIRHLGEYIGLYIGIVMEVLAIVLALIAAVQANSSGIEMRDILPFFSHGVGLLPFIILPFTGFVVVIVTRVISETYSALAAIANNTKKN